MTNNASHLNISGVWGKCVNVPMSRVHHYDGRKCEWPVVENKKIISGKINNAPPNDSRLYRGGGENKNITYWPPVLYTGSFKPNHATGLLHEMVDFKKTSRTSQPCW